MMYESLVRNISYPLWLIFDGQYKAIPYLYKYERINHMSLDEILGRQANNLSSLLKHANSTTTYYQKIFNEYGFNPDSYSLDSFRKLPLITKKIVRERLSDISSDLYSENNRFPASTGGSTGMPMHFYRDRECLYKRRGQELLFDRWMGYEIGKKVALFVASSHHDNIRNRIKYKIKNITSNRLLNFDPSKINIEYSLNFIKSFNKYKPFMIKCFPNSLTAFSEILVGLNIKPISVTSISCTGENLYDNQKSLFTDLYKGEIFEKYGTKECGVISSECSCHNGQHIFAEGVFLEIIDGNGNHVKNGELGRVIVTDLFNYAFPLIRYDIGDMAIADYSESCPCGVKLPKLKKIIGRDRDIIIDTEGNPKPGYLFVEIINKYNLPGQYQIIQKSPDSINIHIVSETTEIDTNKLRRDIRDIAGEKMIVNISFVKSIPREPSGKYAYVKSELRVNK